MIRRIAMLDPVSDAGIGGYTHELANALVRAGCEVDVYTRRITFTAPFARRYRQFPVLGRPLASQRARLRALFRGTVAPPCGRWHPSPAWRRASPQWREHVLSIELATFLAQRGYDAVWTQWPSLGAQEGVFRDACRGLGMPLVHTVHNVLPHENSHADHAAARAVYRSADALVVHSHAAQIALHTFAPDCADRTIIARHGLYSIYQRRPSARAAMRTELGVGDDDTLLLIFGGIRPYKNVDACIAALPLVRRPHVHLAICGWEYGYADASADDPLAHTRRVVNERAPNGRVHLVPGPVDVARTESLFEAADAVLLPYRESWGSGQLLMAMTFGRTVLASVAGGMQEYLADYAANTRVDDITPSGIARAIDSLGSHPLPTAATAPRPPLLEWDAIAPALLESLRRQLGGDGGSTRSAAIRRSSITMQEMALPVRTSPPFAQVSHLSS